MKLRTGETIYTILRHRSSSGMLRVIDAIVIRKNRPLSVRAFLTEKQKDRLDKWQKYDHDRNGWRIGGCGMDMGFHLVYTIGSICRPKGFKVKGIGRNGDTSGHDKDGGYAFKQEGI